MHALRGGQNSLKRPTHPHDHRHKRSTDGGDKAILSATDKPLYFVRGKALVHADDNANGEITMGLFPHAMEIAG